MADQQFTPSVFIQKVFLGKPVSFLNIASTAIFFSIVIFLLFELPALIPLPSFPVPTIPGDYFALVGIFFFMTIILRKPFMLLRYPRTNDWAFLTGMTYKQRQIISHWYVKRKLLECLVFICVFLLMRYVLIFVFDKQLSIISLALPEIPLFLFFGVLYYYSSRIVNTIPVSKKEYLTKLKKTSGKLSKKGSYTFLLSFSRLFAFFADKSYKIVIIRMTLYILRKDKWGTLFLHIAAIAICITAASLLPWSTELLVRIVLMAAPVLLLGEHRETIVNSIVKAYECPYYYFSKKNFESAGVYITIVTFIPYLIIYLIRQIAYSNQFEGVAFISQLLSMTALCLVIGKGFYEMGKPGKTNSTVASYAISIILCALMPWIALCFSSLLIIMNIYPQFAKGKINLNRGRL